MTQAVSSPQPAEMAQLSVKDFAAITAAKTPIPGGGSVAGVVGALAAALGEMSIAFTAGKKKFAAHEAAYAAALPRLARARGMFLDLMFDDATAYSFFQEVSKMEGPEKEAKAAAALAAAINVPREMTAVAITVLEELAALADKCNPYLLTDLGAAAILSEAVVRLCDYNVRVNAATMADKDTADQLRQVSRRDRGRAAELCRIVDEAVGKQV